MFQLLLEMEFKESMMDKEPWLNFLLRIVLQWIISEIFMLEIFVQSGKLIQQVFFGKIDQSDAKMKITHKNENNPYKY